MYAQREMSAILNNFLQNKDCMNDFVDNLDIDTYKDFTHIGEPKGLLLCDDELCAKAQNTQDKNLSISGFIIKYDNVDIIVLNPEKERMYLKFWGYRNFYVFRLARWCSWKNDKRNRYVINLSDKDMFKNSLSRFDKFDNFYIMNIYEKNENLKNWIDALFEGN